MPTPNKKTDSASRGAVYLDADDDIAAVIETVKSARGQTVALVLPKRNDVFKSIVNLKLIKRVGEQLPKTIVLVTTDPTIIGLAARLRLLVSPNLQTKPSVPPGGGEANFDAAPSMAPIEIKPPLVASKSWRNRRTPSRPPKRPARPARPGRRQYHGWFWLAVGLLIALAVVGFLSLPEPSATITIRTRTESANAQLEAELRLDLDRPDWEADPVRLPLVVSDLRSTLTADVTATGQRSIGNYASGDITVINCRPTRLSLPNQTVVSRDGLSFVTLESLNLGPSNANCDVFPGTSGTVRVRATQFGTNYNLASGAYLIDSLDRPDYRANGGRMAGGSQRLVTIINQSDIDQAVDQVDADRDDRAVQQQLEQQLAARGLQPLPATFQAVAQKPQSTVEVGDELDGGQVQLVINYRLAGVETAFLNRLAEAELAPKTGDLALVDNGLATANYRLSQSAAGGADYDLRVDIFEARIGLGLDQETLFNRVRGQSRKAAAASLRRLPGVTTVEVSLSPFWHTTVPADSSRVTIVILDQQTEAGQLDPAEI